jgi:RNA-directed DNA polymerase
MVRYADDFVILCKTEEQAKLALATVRAWVAQAGLSLHPEKTRIVTAQQEAFEFLGYRFDKGRKWPRRKSEQKLRDTLRPYLKRTSGLSLERIIARINPTLRGWFGYFKHAEPSAMVKVDKWVRMRLRSLLRKRLGSKGRGVGHYQKLYPNAYFAALGLFTLKEARRMACQSVKTAH